MRYHPITPVLVGVVVAAVSCSYSSPTSPAKGPSSGASDQIEAVGTAQGCTSGGYNGGTTCTYFFNPTPDTVSAGAALSFKFDDVGHTVVWDTPGAPANISQPTTNTVVQEGMPAPGTYTYHCTVHTYMHGTLVVK